MTGWLVTGAAGMLGRDVTRLARASGADVTGLARGELDITDAASVLAAVRELRPDIVVNCAAWTAVDGAESREAAALAVNGAGAANIAAACAAAGAAMVQISTDYVFSGTGTQPYPEDCPRARAPPTAAPSSPASRPCCACFRRPVTCCGPPGCTGLTGATSSPP
jgi:dTDP-4-dehydrorhamnose reductase